MEDLLSFGFYPGLAIFATFCLWAIANELEKLNKKK
jgi:hypothetical protein